MQVQAVVFSVGLLLVVLELVRRRRLVEEYALLWIVLALVLFGLSMRRGAIGVVAGWLGGGRPPSTVLLMVAVAVCGAGLWISVVVSRQRQQIERLTEETAVLSAELRDLRSRSKP